jgi:hypothetical protein
MESDAMKLRRLPDWRIRNGILHHYQGTRQEALGYFADSLTEDHAVMPVAIQAIEKWGWEEAFEFSHVMTGLTQSEGTLLWLVSEMAKVGKPEDAARSNHCMHLSRMISGADVGLLREHRTKIMTLEGLHPKERARIEDRVGLLGQDAASCWHALERLCEEGKKKDYVTEVDMGHAYELVEAISREGDAFAGRVLDLLSEEITDYRNNPMKWMEGLVARLAGEMRLEAAVPMLVEKLLVDGDWTNEQCSRALIRIGTDSAVEAIADEYVDAEDHYRIYAMGALEDIHSDASLEACLQLFNAEDDLEFRFNIAHAILRQYSPDTIKAMHDFAVDAPPHRERNSLRERLVAVAALTGNELPEHAEWREEAHAIREDAGRLWRERLERIPALGPGGEFPDVAEPSVMQAMFDTKKPARNAPCPCGSGKKYKRCCGRKAAGSP